MSTEEEASGFISDNALQEMLRNSRNEEVARRVMEGFPEQWREELIRYWRKAGRLDELPVYYEWLIQKFYEIRRARPLEIELNFALGELTYVEADLGAADAAHVYVLASAAWTDFEAELKRQLLERDDEEAYELFIRKLFELGLDVGVYLQQQPISPYFEGAAKAAHKFAFLAFQAYWYRPEEK